MWSKRLHSSKNQTTNITQYYITLYNKKSSTHLTSRGFFHIILPNDMKVATNLERPPFPHPEVKPMGWAFPFPSASADDSDQRERLWAAASRPHQNNHPPMESPPDPPPTTETANNVLWLEIPRKTTLYAVTTQSPKQVNHRFKPSPVPIPKCELRSHWTQPIEKRELGRRRNAHAFGFASAWGRTRVPKHPHPKNQITLLNYH